MTGILVVNARPCGRGAAQGQLGMQHSCADPVASSLPSVSHTLPLTDIRPRSARVHSWSISSHSQAGLKW